MRERPVLIRTAAVSGVAVPLAFLVGRGGSPPWQGPRGRGVVGLARGRVAGGGGIAPAGITKSGFGAVAAAGVVALVAGLVSLALGLADLGRSKGGWRVWATRAVALLVCAVLFLALGIAVAVTNVPPTGLGPETPADRGLAFEEVAFTTDDGVTLSGWYGPSANEAAVLLLHGAGSTRSSL